MRSQLESWLGRSALVTGATGFIGQRLCARLEEKGAHVHMVSRHPGTNVSEACTRHAVDVRDAAALRRVFASACPEVVFHLAGPSSASRDASLVLPMLESNLVAGVQLLDLCRQFSVRRVVLAGSMEEPVGSESAASDDSPSSPYAAAKWASTIYGRMFWKLYGLSVVTARIFMAYGPRQPDERKLIPSTIIELLEGRVPRFTSGARAVDWIHVDDVVSGLLAIAESNGLETTPVDIGTGRLTSVRRVVEMLFEILQSPAAPRFGEVADRPAETVRAANVAVTRALTGWQASIELEDGLRETVAWYRARGCVGTPRPDPPL